MGDQRGRDRRIGDGDAAALATRSARVLRGEDREKRASDRQAAKVRAALDPDHAAATAGLMRGHREIGQRPHARAVEAERHHAAAGQVDHRLRRGGGPARRLLLERLSDEAVTGGKWLVVGVGVIAAEEHHIAGGQRPVLEFPLADDLRPDQVARARLSLVAARCDVDHAGLAAELPGGNFFTRDETHRPGPGQPRIGRRHEVRGGIPLGAGVLVDDEHVAVATGTAKRRGGHDGERRHAHWPDAGMLWRNDERQILDGGCRNASGASGRLGGHSQAGMACDRGQCQREPAHTRRSGPTCRPIPMVIVVSHAHSPSSQVSSVS